MIVSMNVSHFVKIGLVLTILHQLICRGVANFGTRCSFELQQNEAQANAESNADVTSRVHCDTRCHAFSVRWKLKLSFYEAFIRPSGSRISLPGLQPTPLLMDYRLPSIFRLEEGCDNTATLQYSRPILAHH